MFKSSDAHTLRRAWATIFALILLLMLPNLIWLFVGFGSTPWLTALALPAALMIILFALFGERLWLACLLLTPFAALAPIEAIYVVTYRHPTNAEILATLVATNPRETFEYLGSALIPVLLCIFAGIALALLATVWSKRSACRWSHRSRAWVLLAATALLLTGFIGAFTIPARLHAGSHMLNELDDLVEPSYPFGLFPRIVQYRSEWNRLRANAAQLDAFRFGAHRSSIISKRQIYVLVIGESSRRNHWQLFGYQRPTNPELLHVSNLIPIPNMLTSWPESIAAIPLVLTRKPIDDMEISWKEPSIIRAMQEAGFDTWWISNQLPMGKFDSPVSTYALEANHTIFLNHASMYSPGSYDDVLLKPLQDALKTSGKDLFIVMHMMGSHLSYDMRYPQSFKYFKPTYQDSSSKVSPGERFTNSYDNTILYTDHVLSQVIGILKMSGSITAMFFTSDHGEALLTPTCSQAGHGISTRYEFEIPALFWYSDSYAQAFPNRLSAIRGNATKPLLSGDIFESLIDMAGVDFPGHDTRKSFFSTDWQYQPRIVNAIWQVDFDKAVFSKKCTIVLPSDANTDR